MNIVDIKFRAYDGTMRYSEWYGLSEFFAMCSKDQIMQYAGLKDNRGKDVYEGDILTYTATNMSEMEVIFEDGCWKGKGPFNTRPLTEYLQALDFISIEVTGNIYEQQR